MKKRDEKRLREIADQLTGIRDELIAIVDALDTAKPAAAGYVVRVGDACFVVEWDAKIWKNRDKDDREWGRIARRTPYVFATRKDAEKCVKAWREVEDTPREVYAIEEYDPAAWNR